MEAPLEGTQIIVKNNDQPGVIGAVGTVLGRHGVNIANFALGRGSEGAIGVVTVDEANGVSAGDARRSWRRFPRVKSVEVVQATPVDARLRQRDGEGFVAG